MSSTVDLRKKVLEYIQSADDRLLHMIQELAESYQKQEGVELSEAQKVELDKRLERFKRGETQFYTWEETKAKIIK
jgi:putative addiction module component (TIGR02574 family)